MAPPAPWRLSGSAYVLYVRGGRRLASRILMVVRYDVSPVGPYEELLYCRRRRFGDLGKWNVDPIFVSSQDSVDGGRSNWGLPKRLGAFSIDDRGPGGMSAEVSFPQAGQRFAKLDVRGFGPSLAVRSTFVPTRWLGFAQVADGTRFEFTPRVSSRVRLAKVVALEVKAPFPLLGAGDVRAALHLPRFEVEFPVSQTCPEAS